MEGKAPQTVEGKEPLATEIYKDLIRETKFKERVIFWLSVAVILLIIALAGTNLYHIHQWSQFDTIVVDSGEGSGNANYVQGDNTGGIYNGQSGSAPEEGREIQGDQNQA